MERYKAANHDVTSPVKGRSTQSVSNSSPTRVTNLSTQPQSKVKHYSYVVAWQLDNAEMELQSGS